MKTLKGKIRHMGKKEINKNSDAELADDVGSSGGLCGNFKVYEDGQECSRFCANHVKTPCEKCGRKSARGRVEIPIFDNGKGEL